MSSFSFELVVFCLFEATEFDKQPLPLPTYSVQSTFNTRQTLDAIFSNISLSLFAKCSPSLVTCVGGWGWGRGEARIPPASRTPLTLPYMLLYICTVHELCSRTVGEYRHGTIASYWQNTSSPKYNDDISLLISQYLISGWTHSSLSPLQCPSSSRMYYSSWTYTDPSNHTTVNYFSFFNKTQLLKNNELFTNLNKLLVSNYQQLSPTSFTLTSFVSWNYRPGVPIYGFFNNIFTVVYLLTVFFSFNL